MKKRICKILLITAVMLLSLACLMLAVACGHAHQVNKWKIVKEPTCTNEGLERGACVECGEVIEQAVPTVQENHIYGEWEITVAPTYARDGAGLATKYCKENPEHKITATLPRLTSSGSGYDFYEVVKEATVLEDGKVTAIYVHDMGNISFTVSTKKKEFDIKNCTVEDAVLMGSSNKDLIRKGSGLIASGWDNSLEHPGSFSYEYGEDYVHTSDGDDRRELWVSRNASGQPFGVLCTVAINGAEEIIKYPRTRENHLKGYEYNISWAGKTFFGAEGLLYDVYDWGTRNANRDFEEEITTNSDGEKVYKFKFGYFNTPNHFCKLNCEFTLTESYAIRYLKLSTDTFVAVGNSTDQFYTVKDADDNTICYLYDGIYLNDAVYREFITYNQITKEESPEEPVHEYTEAAFQIGDFDLMYNNKIYTDEKPASFTAGGSPIIFDISNVQAASGLSEVKNPVDLFNYDPLSLYRVTETGRRIPLTFSTDDDMVWYRTSKVLKNLRLTIYSKLAGTIKLLLRTDSGYEKEFSVICKPASPTILYPMAYEYSDAGYAWRTSTSTSLSTTVYVGQSITLNTALPEDVKSYTDGSYTAELDSANATVEEIEGTGCVKFVASVAGVYTVKLRSTAKSTTVATVTVIVEEAPNVNDFFVGEYSAKLKKFEAKVLFETKDGKTLAHITTNKGVETLSLTYDSQYNVITCEHVDGAELGVMILVNEAYRLVFANPTGFGSGMEESILYVVEPDTQPDEPIE